MSDSISDGRYQIVSLTEGNPPAGVDGRSRMRVQWAYLNASATTWGVKREGHNTYRLRVGAYPYTGVAQSGVLTSMDSEPDVAWIATCREDQGAYTITPANDQNKGWTVHPNDEGNRVTVEIKSIVPTSSDPPQFLPSQLWRFEPVHE